MEPTTAIPNPAPVATPPAPELDSAAYQAKIAELERQSEGRLRDLQDERRKRQELESKVNQPVSPPEPEKGVTDELAKVLSPYLKPVEERAKRAESYLAQIQQDKALEFLASKTGKSKDAVFADNDMDNKLTSIVKRYKLTGDIYDVTQRAWEILELENLRTQDADRRRQENVNSQGNSIPSGTHTPTRPAPKVYDEEDFSAMPLREYEDMVAKGTFLMNKAGKVEYTPHSK